MAVHCDAAPASATAATIGSHRLLPRFINMNLHSLDGTAKVGCDAAPSTMLRMVPLPRVAGEDKPAPAFSSPVWRSETGEGDHA